MWVPMLLISEFMGKAKKALKKIGNTNHHFLLFRLFETYYGLIMIDLIGTSYITVQNLDDLTNNSHAILKHVTRWGKTTKKYVCFKKKMYR